MQTGVVLNYGETFADDVRWCLDNGIPSCQLHVPHAHLTDADARRIRAIRQHSGLQITALIGLWSGPMVWDFVDGPSTLGIVPTAYRHRRMDELARAAAFAAGLEVGDVCTHMGFIPENPSDPLYREFIAAARHLAGQFRALGIRLNMETGQETPVTLRRALDDIGQDNVGVNFDPANLLMYGKANPIDALSMILAGRIHGVHAKDGNYPADGQRLGEETPLGQGMVNIPAFIEKLKSIGYSGAVTIEREISGAEQRRDVLAAHALLKSML